MRFLPFRLSVARSVSLLVSQQADRDTGTEGRGLQPPAVLLSLQQKAKTPPMILQLCNTMQGGDASITPTCSV